MRVEDNKIKADTAFSDPKLDEIVNRIVEAVRPTRIYLFGSRARGDARAESDYDLLLVYDGSLSKRDVELVVYKIFHLSQFAADLFILTSDEYSWQQNVATTIAREVREHGIAVYGY